MSWVWDYKGFVSKTKAVLRISFNHVIEISYFDNMKWWKKKQLPNLIDINMMWSLSEQQEMYSNVCDKKLDFFLNKRNTIHRFHPLFINGIGVYCNTSISIQLCSKINDSIVVYLCVWLYSFIQLRHDTPNRF